MAKVYVGVDIGSLTVKVVLIDQEARIVAHDTARAGYSGREVAVKMVAKLLTESGLGREDVGGTVATGYGRITFPADREVSEITCQARGIHHLFPTARTVIDIGGQDSKVIQMLPNGKVVDFAMNDKCAAGTGRFLEVMASALEISLNDIGNLAETSRNPTAISSFCTVFAESEVITHVSAGKPKEDILAGVCASVASRVASLAQRIGLVPDLVFTGGVARNQGVLAALRRQLSHPLLVYSEPSITAAWGAALMASRQSPSA